MNRYVYIYIYICIYIYIYVDVCMFLSLSNIYIYIDTYVCIYIYIYIYTYTYIYTHRFVYDRHRDRDRNSVRSIWWVRQATQQMSRDQVVTAAAVNYFCHHKKNNKPCVVWHILSDSAGARFERCAPPHTIWRAPRAERLREPWHTLRDGVRVLRRIA